MGKIVFYTIHCPKCKILQQLLSDKHLDFEIVDNKDEVLKVADENHIQSAPFAIIDGKCYDTKELQEWIKEQ